MTLSTGRRGAPQSDSSQAQRLTPRSAYHLHLQSGRKTYRQTLSAARKRQPNDQALRSTCR